MITQFFSLFKWDSGSLGSYFYRHPGALSGHGNPCLCLGSCGLFLTEPPQRIYIYRYISSDIQRKPVPPKIKITKQDLLSHARKTSFYLVRKYENIPLDTPLSAYPSVAKQEMMANFDSYLCDRCNGSRIHVGL